MLLQLQDTNAANLMKLIDFAHQLNLELKVVDDNEKNVALPGKPLSAKQLEAMIESSRQSETINLQSAHQIIRKNFKNLMCQIGTSSYYKVKLNYFYLHKKINHSND